MTIQFGKNPEFTISLYCNAAALSGEVALPVSLSWWYTNDVEGNKNFDISLYILCFGFTIEIWRWNKESSNG